MEFDVCGSSASAKQFIRLFSSKVDVGSSYNNTTNSMARHVKRLTTDLRYTVESDDLISYCFCHEFDLYLTASMQF